MTHPSVTELDIAIGQKIARVADAINDLRQELVRQHRNSRIAVTAVKTLAIHLESIASAEKDQAAAAERRREMLTAVEAALGFELSAEGRRRLLAVSPKPNARGYETAARRELAFALERAPELAGVGSSLRSLRPAAESHQVSTPATILAPESGMTAESDQAASLAFVLRHMFGIGELSAALRACIVAFGTDSHNDLAALPWEEASPLRPRVTLTACLEALGFTEPECEAIVEAAETTVPDKWERVARYELRVLGSTYGGST